MKNAALKNPARRKFLRSAPAAAGLLLADRAISLPEAQAQGAPLPVQHFAASEIEADVKALKAAPGNNNLVTSPNMLVILTVEKDKAGKEFEWHEGRDHVFTILEGETSYELGGTPKGGHSTRPHEWLAPESEGAKTYLLKKGDMIFIPRGTPHRRTTKGTAVFTLISAQDKA